MTCFHGLSASVFLGELLEIIKFTFLIFLCHKTTNIAYAVLQHCMLFSSVGNSRKVTHVPIG